MKLIVGLGNPGKKYFNTRHNIGFLCVDQAVHNHKLSFYKEKKFHAILAKHQNTLFVKPQTYMNLSGQSVKAVMDYYKIEPHDVLVIYDDLDLPTAKLRLRYTGSSGGHKGLQSIIDHLHTDELKRVKFGIDRSINIDAKDYVLQAFYKQELDEVIKSIKTVSLIIEDFIKELPFEQIMTKYN